MVDLPNFSVCNFLIAHIWDYQYRHLMIQNFVPLQKFLKYPGEKTNYQTKHSFRCIISLKTSDRSLVPKTLWSHIRVKQINNKINVN